MDNRVTDIYSRQEKLLMNDYHDKSAIVIGLGGIGSWIALDLALLGIGTLILIDPDTIESSNLNRTLYRLEDIGKKKTVAIQTLINERRSDIIIKTIEDYFAIEHLDEYEVDYVFDCSDTLNCRKKISEMITNSKALITDNHIDTNESPYNNPDETSGEANPDNKTQMLMANGVYIKCGYDGYYATISINDFNSGSWGEDGSYNFVSSFFGTPQIISALAVIEIVINESEESRTINFQTDNLLNIIEEKGQTVNAKENE